MPLLNIRRDPAVAHFRAVEARLDRVHAGPSAIAIPAGADDVEQFGKLGAHPDTGIVLIGDRVDAQLAYQASGLLRRPVVSDPIQRLSKRIGAAPDRNP